MNLLLDLPRYKNGNFNPNIANKLERAIIAYYSKPGGVLQTMHPYFSTGSATLDRASNARRELEKMGCIYIALIERELVTDIGRPIDPYEMDELRKCGARGLSFRAAAQM